MTAAEMYPREDWQYDVLNGDTLLGYLDWVKHQVESHLGDGEQNQPSDAHRYLEVE